MMNNWRKRELDKPSEEHESYRKIMAEVKKNFEPKKNTDQPESTKRLLASTDAEAAERRKQLEDPYMWIMLKEKSKADPYVMREITPEEFALVDRNRRSPKNSLGCSDKVSPSEQRKEAATNAFIFTPAAEIDPLKEVKQLEVVKELLLNKITEKEQTLTPFKKQWFSLKRKARIEKMPERMSFMELQEHWRKLNETS